MKKQEQEISEKPKIPNKTSLRIALREGRFCKLLLINNLREGVVKIGALAKLLKYKGLQRSVFGVYHRVHFALNGSYIASNLTRVL